MDGQEVFHANCDEHEQWLVAPGMHPDTPWTQVIRLVKGAATRPVTGWPKVFPDCQPSDPHKPFDVSTDE
jgi:hypothetical protein